MRTKKLTFLITSGPTREYLDPVRYLSNASSGKMGCALAMAAHRQGHRVIFVTGPAVHASPRGARIVTVISARDMFRQVKKWLPQADIVIGAAAVSDYRPRSVSARKIKKSDVDCTLSLVENPDIIGFVGTHKSRAVVVGFALETADATKRAQKKLFKKNLDLIVANGPRSLDSAKTSACIIGRNGLVARREKITKSLLAGEIVHESLRLHKNNFAD
ncbi:MAG: phosphopantothenoylcysteine decarboxylase [Elusimicrobiota bacterium]